jgi:predicted aspartyl protease
MLPPDAAITQLTAVEYSEGGAKELGATMMGAGGSVSGFLGVTRLKELRIGSIIVSDISVSVIDRMPEFGNLKLAGVLGLDVLQRGGVARLKFDTATSGTLSFRKNLEPLQDHTPIEIPFKMAAKHIFLDASFDGIPVDAVFDTGARRSIVSEKVAEKSGLQPNLSDVREFRGLDGTPTEAHGAMVSTLQLGATHFEPTRFYIAPLDVFDTMGITESGALLGADFVRRYPAIDVDFVRRQIRLWKY